MAVSTSSVPIRTVRKRLWRFRLASIGLGLLPLLLAELLLRGLGLPSNLPPVDPFVDLHALRPLFEAAPEPGFLEIGKRRMNLFRPASFRNPKPEGTFRIFALGGSTTQGEPYSTETAFPFWLGLNLQAASSDQTIEVINCGGLSYASYRVLAILGEVLQYEPDLIVIYSGQNEFLERRVYDGNELDNVAARSRSWLAGMRTVQFVQSLFGVSSQRPDPPNRTELAAEVDALLDYQGGLEEYTRGDRWHASVTEHFRWNLEQMVVRCQQARVPLILMRPVTNLLDCPPMKFEVAPDLSPDDQLAFQTHWELARRGSEEPELARRHAQAALAIDPEHAGANFLLGRLQYAAGEFDEARRSLVRARDKDVCPLRATTEIADVVTGVARRYGAALVDAEAIFSDRSEHGIVGQRWLVDHIHPTVDGHQVLGEVLAEKCIEVGILEATNSDWQRQRPRLYREHLSQLGEEYFHRGKQRLEGLILWTQGRAKKVRLADQ